MNEHVESLNQVKATVVDPAIKFGPKVFVAIAIMVAGYFAGRWVGKAMARGLRKFDLEPPVRDLLVRVIRILVLGMFAIMALQNLGVELLPLIAGIGVAGAGIALAMQGVLGNVVAGLTIIFTRPFRIGEYIAIAGVEGKVENITLFNTTLMHADLSQVIVPNRKIVGDDPAQLRQSPSAQRHGRRCLRHGPEQAAGDDQRNPARQSAGADGSGTGVRHQRACRFVDPHLRESVGECARLRTARQRDQQSPRGNFPREIHFHPVPAA
jgi:hypothetical protein